MGRRSIFQPNTRIFFYSFPFPFLQGENEPAFPEHFYADVYFSWMSVFKRVFLNFQ